jgi:hypothetical protein
LFPAEARAFGNAQLRTSSSARVLADGNQIEVQHPRR